MIQFNKQFELVTTRSVEMNGFMNRWNNGPLTEGGHMFPGDRSNTLQSTHDKARAVTHNTTIHNPHGTRLVWSVFLTPSSLQALSK
jgi:hypothetical protein